MPVSQAALRHKENLARARALAAADFEETGRSIRKVTVGAPVKAPVEAARLALKMRRRAAEGSQAPWIIAFAFAIACDGMDMIPVAGWIVSWFFRPFLFIFLWGKGTWKLRLGYYAILLIDFIPAISMLPLSTVCVYYAYRKNKKRLSK